MEMELTTRQRVDAAVAMYDEGLNKCEDCCLVPNCPTCGPCEDHDGETETRTVLAWAGDQGIDLRRPA